MIVGIGVLQNAHGFSSAGSEWLGTLPGKLDTTERTSWLVRDTEQPFTKIKRAIQRADMAKTCEDSFGYFDITSLRCVPDLKRDPSRDRLSICFGRTWPRVCQ
jgi:hypothetical protein